MSIFRVLLALGALTALSACGDSRETEPPTAAPEPTAPETDDTDSVMSSPQDHGCGDGTVDPGETCDDGNANCPDGWGLCMRCEYCERWTLSERTYVPSADDESPLPNPPFCTETVQQSGARRPVSVRVRTYDDHGRLISDTLDTDPNTGPQRTTYEYDEDGHRVAEVRTVGDRTLWADRHLIVDGRRVGTRRDLNDDDLVDEQRRYTYDDDGRMTSVETRNGITVTFDYDAFGRLTSERGGGQQIEIERDDRGRMIHRAPSDRIPFTYRHDDDGHLVVELADSLARRDRWNHTYENGRLVRSVYRSDPDTVARRCEITTDERGRVTERACDNDLDGEADRTTTYDYACVDALRDSLPRTVSDGPDDEADEPSD